MDKQQRGIDRLAAAAKSRSKAQQRQAERVDEIAGLQARLKQEAQERRERRKRALQRPKAR